MLKKRSGSRHLVQQPLRPLPFAPDSPGMRTDVSCHASRRREMGLPLAPLGLRLVTGGGGAGRRRAGGERGRCSVLKLEASSCWSANSGLLGSWLIGAQQFTPYG